jgi:hypothetical protein
MIAGYYDRNGYPNMYAVPPTMDFFLPQTQPGERENALSAPRMRDMTISVDGGMQTALDRIWE